MVKKVISKEVKVKRVDTNLKLKKAPTKSELELQVKDLLQANDALEKSNRQKIELLESFGGKIENLERQIDYLSCKETMICKETQTEAGINTKCDECNFEAESERELGWHMGRSHGWSSVQKGDSMDISLLSTDPRNCEKCGYKAESMYDLDAHTWDVHDESISCNFCENTFEDKRDLMKHKKEEHTDRVVNCWHYSAGMCPYGEEKCWFIHNKEHANLPASEYVCNFCEQMFGNQSEFLKHRKTKHNDHVPTCKKFKNGECIYGNEKCWYNHKTEQIHNDKEKDIENEDNTNIMNKNEIENKEVIQRIMQMMETLTERIINIENRNQKI